MVVIFAAAYPGLHTPSLRLPYLYANSGGLYMKRKERAIRHITTTDYQLYRHISKLQKGAC